METLVHEMCHSYLKLFSVSGGSDHSHWGVASHGSAFQRITLMIDEYSQMYMTKRLDLGRETGMAYDFSRTMGITKRDGDNIATNTS